MPPTRQQEQQGAQAQQPQQPAAAAQDQAAAAAQQAGAGATAGGGGGNGGLLPGAYPAQAQPQPPNAYMQQYYAQQALQEELSRFWQRMLVEAEAHSEVLADFKNQQLPLARIKKIMKSDEDVRMISAEAPVLFARACEYFIQDLTLRSWSAAQEYKRRTMQRSDVATAISRTDIYDFLVDIVPREEANDPAGASGDGGGSGQLQGLPPTLPLPQPMGQQLPGMYPQPPQAPPGQQQQQQQQQQFMAQPAPAQQQQQQGPGAAPVPGNPGGGGGAAQQAQQAGGLPGMLGYNPYMMPPFGAGYPVGPPPPGAGPMPPGLPTLPPQFQPQAQQQQQQFSQAAGGLVPTSMQAPSGQQ